MGAAEMSIDAAAVMPLRAYVTDVVTSSEHPAGLTTLLCELVKVALGALREAQASGAAEEMDEDTRAELAALVQGGEDDKSGEEGESGKGGGAGESGKKNQARGRKHQVLAFKRPRRASARSLSTADASPEASSAEFTPIHT